ncbi:response regulator transcription factor [candidate division KSB1 bacterium]|nr:response regulator transcription factor [candidate division KSB1 bacterium]
MKNTTTSVTVMLVDKDAAALNGLKLLLEIEDDIKVVGQVAKSDRILVQVRKYHPNVVLMDFFDSYSQGLDIVKRISSEFPGIKIIIMTTYPIAVREVLHAGACHVFLKDCVPDELFDAIRNQHSTRDSMSKSH